VKDGATAVLDALLALLLVSLVWFEGGASPSGLFLAHTIIFLLAAGALLLRMRRGTIALPLGWEMLAGLGVAAACLISFLRVDYLFGPFLSLWNVAMTILLAVAMILLGGSRWRLRAGAVAAASAAQAIFVLVAPGKTNLTPSGTFANANQLAAYLNVGAFLALGLAIDLRRAGRRIAAGACLAMALLDLGVILMVGARGALLSTILVSALWSAAAARALPRRAKILLAGALVLLALASAVSVAARFERIFDPYLFDRVRIWRAGVEAALDHPILGMGPGMFEARGYRYAFPLEREMFQYSKRAGSTHATYLQALVETGLIGLAALAALLALLVPRLWRLRTGETSEGAAGACAALALLVCLVHGIVDMPFDVPVVTLSLLALVLPLLTPARPGDAALYLALPSSPGPSRRLATLALAAIATPAWLGGVALPYAADLSFARGAVASRPGAPDPSITRAIVMNPYNPAYPAGRAEIAWRRDRPLDLATFAAVDLDLEEAHRIDPGRPEPLLRLAQLHARACFDLSAGAASTQRAEGYYREALALGLKDPRPYLELALFLLARGSPVDEPVALISRALALEPRYLEARLAMARALLVSGRQEETEQELDRLALIRRELTGYAPRNGYEEDLMRLDSRELKDLEARLAQLTVPPSQAPLLPPPRP
jgi:tetratricopeptide (TPR) repeat protein